MGKWEGFSASECCWVGSGPWINFSRLSDTHGVLLMLSIPPAAIIFLCPKATFCAAREIAFMPEAQTLLMVVASVVSGQPAARTT